MPTEHEMCELADAMSQVLDDMGPTGNSVCLLAKAKARIAFEPFRDPADTACFMSLDDARQIVREVEDSR